jgi:long-subunit acyl-CoA synthetase (AMP-forming)
MGEGNAPRDIPALSASTLCEAFQVTAAERGDAVAVRLKGDAAAMTWTEYAGRVASAAGGLARLGIERGEAVAILLTNRPEFHLVDAAVMHLGAVPFSLYNSAAREQLAQVLHDSGARTLITETKFAETADVLRDAVGVDRLIFVDTTGPGSLAELESGGPEPDFEERWRAVQPEDLATLIYTSGTTGPPKCVKVTHRGLIAEWAGLHQVFDITPGGRILSWLPAAHIADRLLGQYQHICFGHTITCVPDIRELGAHLVEVRPTFWVAVPRVYEKFRASLLAGFTPEQHAALEVGLRYFAAVQTGKAVDPELAATCARLDAEVFAPVRASLGLDRAEQFVVGASPIPAPVLEFFHAFGMPVCEVWGMSELPIATANPPSRPKVGTVGLPVPGVELRLDTDGELLLRGAMLMRGYRDPEHNAASMDADGWWRTGDVGVLDEDGYVTIVDRKKELIISSTGKNMSPANIEAELKSASQLIGHAVAVGDNRPYNVALLVLDPDGLAAFASRAGLTAKETAALAAEPAVLQAVAEAVEVANSRLSRPEQIRRHVVLGVDWLPGGDELTPTSKLRRKPIAEKYATEIARLYEGGQAEVFDPVEHLRSTVEKFWNVGDVATFMEPFAEDAVCAPQADFDDDGPLIHGKAEITRFFERTHRPVVWTSLRAVGESTVLGSFRRAGTSEAAEDDWYLLYTYEGRTIVRARYYDHVKKLPETC